MEGGTGHWPVMSGNLPDKEENTRLAGRLPTATGKVARSTQIEIGNRLFSRVQFGREGGTGHWPVLSGNLPDKEENRKAGRQVADRNGQVVRSTQTEIGNGLFSRVQFGREGGTGHWPVLSGNLPDKEENRKAGRQVADRNGQVVRSTQTEIGNRLFS